MQADPETARAPPPSPFTTLSRAVHGPVTGAGGDVASLRGDGADTRIRGDPSRRSGGPARRPPRACLGTRAVAVRAGAGPARGARPQEGAHRRARRALRHGLGRTAARAGPLRRRVRPQAAVEAGARGPGVALHPHPLRVRLPLRAGALSRLHRADFTEPTSSAGTGVGRHRRRQAQDFTPFSQGWPPPRTGWVSMRKNLLLTLAVSGALAFGVVACGDDDEGGNGAAASDGGGELTGKIAIDGSSTVAPFAEAAAELFQEENSGVQITVGTSGTGGGFEKFCAGETDISDASRSIKDDEEVPLCKDAGVSYTEVQIANDGIAIATNKELSVDCLTTDQLKQVWNKGSNVGSLADVNRGMPDTELSLYGPGTDSGTFDFFTDAINGEEGVSREDYEASEDDNQLVTGVSGDQGGFGYFGFSYYESAADKLNLVGVDSGDGNCVKPSVQTIQDGSYKPLSRPLFMYPSAKAMKRPEVKAFMEFVVAQAPQIAEAAKIVPLTGEQTSLAKDELAKAESGT